MPPLELLTAGEAFEDLVFVGLDRLPRPGEEIKTSRFMATVGGGAVITAVAGARLNLRCGVMSGMGLSAVACLRADRVRVSNLKREGEAHAITAALSTASDRAFVTFNGVNDVLERRLLQSVGQMRARHVHFAFHPRRCRLWTIAVARLRAAGSTTSWDFGWNEPLLDDPHFPSLLRTVDYVFVNEMEARLYAGHPTLHGAIRAWSTAENHVIIKLGAKGSRWVSRAFDVRAEAPTVRALDTTGAGDAFNGGFLYGVLRGHAPRDCLRLGNYVGAMSTRRAGGLDGLPRHRALPARLRSRKPGRHS